MKSTKLVQVVARFSFKGTNKVVYVVRASNGVATYETSLCDGKAVGCSCPSRKPCYHMNQLEVIEAARKPVTPAPVATPVTSVNLDELSVEQIAVIRKEGMRLQKELKLQYRRWYNARLQELKIDQMLAA